jgi:hypothetical protein
LPKKINDKFIEIDKKTFRFFKTKKYILKIFLISFAFQIVQVIFYIFLGLFLGIDLNVYKYFFVVIPLSLLFSSLPVTFGNLGFRESVLIFFLTAIPGVESSYAFVLGVLVYGVKIVMGIPGLYLIIYKKINRRHIL